MMPRFLHASFIFGVVFFARGKTEISMIGRTFVRSVVALTVSAAMLSLSFAPASAFTLASPGAERAATAPQVDKVWWGYRGGRWGWWGPGAVVGGLAAGAIVGSAIAARPYYYGPGPGYAYGPCWRWVGGPWGPHWARVC
jgi:hypothetical protein